MSVLERPFFNLAVIRAPLGKLVEALSVVPSLGIQARATALVFPFQPYTASVDDPPMLLWSPATEPAFTAFMPQVGAGDYFVVELATKRFRCGAVAVRSTVQEVEWPINEFVVHDRGERQRVVRAMRDSPRWEFYTSGSPALYEDTRMYTARRIRDRLRREQLLSYVEQWGAAIRDPRFWQSDQSPMTFVRV